MQIKSLLSLDTDGKSSKDALRRTLALLLDAAEACILSSWRKLKICEELFSTLLNGISEITVSRGGQLLRVLLIPLKPLVLTTCAQVRLFLFLLGREMMLVESAGVFSYLILLWTG